MSITFKIIILLIEILFKIFGGLFVRSSKENLQNVDEREYKIGNYSLTYCISNNLYLKFISKFKITEEYCILHNIISKNEAKLMDNLGLYACGLFPFFPNASLANKEKYLDIH